MLHAPFWKLHLLEEAVIRQEGQNVRKRVADT